MRSWFVYAVELKYGLQECFIAGPSKKLGKAAAAKAALAKLYNVTFSPFTSSVQPNRNLGSAGAAPVSFEQMALPQVLADHIAR